MSSTDRTTSRTRRSSEHDVSSSEFAAMAKTHAEDLARTQNELFDTFRKSSQKWADRLQAEVSLFSELSAKLTSARSIPEAAAACQNYAGQHVLMAGEDAKHLLEDGRVLFETGTRLWSSNWPRGASS
jgi:hypothetical protein